MAVALLVIAQAATSQVMTAPGKNRIEDGLFEIHEFTGIVSFFLIFLFWLYTLLRKGGTRPGLLFPWFNRVNRQALSIDSRRHWRSLAAFRMPEHVHDSPLVSAVHGLGILLMMLMATTGVIWFIAIDLGDMAKIFAGVSKEAHEIFSNLVWAYLVGHAGLALINQFTGRQPLSDMWPVAKDTDSAP
jgi:cytochrome b561